MEDCLSLHAKISYTHDTLHSCFCEYGIPSAFIRINMVCRKGEKESLNSDFIIFTITVADGTFDIFFLFFSKSRASNFIRMISCGDIQMKCQVLLPWKNKKCSDFKMPFANIKFWLFILCHMHGWTSGELPQKCVNVNLFPRHIQELAQ